MGSALALGGGMVAPPAEPVSPSFLHGWEGGPGLPRPCCPSPARHQMQNAAWKSRPRIGATPTPHHGRRRRALHTPPPPTVSGACGCVQRPAPSQPACVKQDAWTGLRSPGPQGRLSQPRPCIHTGQSGDGATLLLLGRRSLRGANMGRRDQAGAGLCEGPHPAPRAPRPASPPAAWHPKQQWVTEIAPGKQPPVPSCTARSLFLRANPGGTLVVVTVLAAPGLCELQL